MSYTINDESPAGRRSRKDSINEVIDLDAPHNTSHNSTLEEIDLNRSANNNKIHSSKI